ncbi:MAG TPA: ATP-binding cassette domain-containing protein [Anaeromyxobacteraceae bacterium]|nr:ATP-binding cassette domain-containing protein [Anaeromyxobacteraceae bacterium]
MALPRGAPIVTLERAAVTLGGVAVLRDVSLALRAGDRVALLGANGSGKSTLLRLLRGDQWLDHRLPGRRTFHLPEDPQESPIGARERMAACGPEDQDAYARRELDLPVEAVIRSGLDAALYPAEEPTPARAARVGAAAAALGVEPLLRRAFLSLSRGEARKVLVARALAPAPDVLLLDEVCDGLDAPARAALLERLAAVAATGTAVVTAVHRAEELFDGIERVLWLEGGRVVADGAREEVVARWRDAFSEPEPEPEPVAVPVAVTPAVPVPVPERAEHAPSPRPSPPREEREQSLFHLSDVTVLVAGRPVLDRLTWRVGAGEAWAVTGPNGAGKSTLLRLLAGEEQPARGRIERLDLGHRADAWALSRRLGLVSPELQARHRFDATGEEVVLSGFAGTVGLSAPPTAAQRQRAAATLASLGLERLARRRVLSCSYGELRLLLLARALAPAPEALLLDEPFAGLDPGARATLRALVDRLARAGTGIVLVTHHEDEVPPAVTRRARLQAGRFSPSAP